MNIELEEIKEWAKKEFKSPNFMWSVKDNVFVIRQKDFSGYFELHIYVNSTIDVSLELYDAISLKVVERDIVEWGIPLSDYKEKIDILYNLGQAQQLCPKCSAHMIKRVNGSNGNTFMGCSAFPRCLRGQQLNREYPLRETITGESIGVLKMTEHKNGRKYDITQKDVLRGAQTLISRGSSIVVICEQHNTKLVEEKDCISTKSYQDLSYKFEKFNRVQSTIIDKQLHKKDCNLVLGTSTSSGKTVCAELFISETFKQNKKVIYVAPLKALSFEKYDDWTKGVFADKEITMLTGDTLWNIQERVKQLRKAEKSDINIMTSELLDSLTRGLSEEDNWIKKVGLIIVDESHILTSPNRGHCVEAGLMRFSKINPSARILCLSATLPNVEDFKTWLKILNKKDTEIINSDWRPTKLNWNFIEYNKFQNYKAQQSEKIAKAMHIIEANKKYKILCFVHDKNTGRILLKHIRAKGIEVDFHSADLSLNNRLEVENKFENDMNVLIATSTLSWGKNTSAKHVIIVGVTRGLNNVDELDISQMGGRAGRVGYAGDGFCHLICDNKEKWQHKIQNPRDVESTLLSEDVLGFHILAEINTGVITNYESLKLWFKRSLASIQAKWDDGLIQKVLTKLRAWDMLYVDNLDNYKLTGLGKVSASLYYKPQDIYHWYKEFGKIDSLDLWDSDLAVSWALGSVPSKDFGYVPKESQERVLVYSDALRKLGLSVYDNVCAADLYDCITGNEARMTISSFKLDSERIREALRMIDKVALWDKDVIWKTLPIRLKYGVGKELVELCSLPDIGFVRAKKLYNKGILGIDDFTEDNRDKICRVLNDDLCDSLIKGRRLKKRLLSI